MRSKAFREVVTGLMGTEPLDGRKLAELVGRAAKLTIVHNDGETQTYANIAAIKPLAKGVKAPRIEQDLVYFSLDPDEFSEATLNTLSDREQEKIRASETYRTTKHVLANQGKPAAAIVDDDFPENLGGAPKAKPRRKPATKATEPLPDDGIAFDAA